MKIPRAAGKKHNNSWFVATVQWISF